MGVAATWSVLAMAALVANAGPPTLPLPSAAAIGKVNNAYVLTDYTGRTLYTFARDGKYPACSSECLEVWRPLRAPALAGALGDWKPMDRPDGIRQWSYRGKLVYTFADDLVAGDARGANAGNVWKIIRLGSDDEGSPTAALTRR
jgi:predicted lipoprotein with Yx(FWY)xxD motif